MRGKRLISLCLLLCMVVGLLPAAAFPVSAASGNTDVLSSLGIDTKPVDTGDRDANPYCPAGVDTSFNMFPHMELAMRDNVADYKDDGHSRNCIRFYDADEGSSDIWNNESFSRVTGGADRFDYTQSVGADLEGTGRKEYLCTVGYVKNEVWLMLYNKNGERVGRWNRLCDGMRTGYGVGYNALAPIEIVAGDFDGDGKDTIWVCTYPEIPDNENHWKTEQVREFEYDGTDLKLKYVDGQMRKISAEDYAQWEYWSNQGMYQLPQVQMTAGDLNGDGKDELIITSGFATNNSGDKADTTARTTIWDCSGSYARKQAQFDHIWKFSEYGGYLSSWDNSFVRNLYGATAVGDVDGDGQNELVMAGWKAVNADDVDIDDLSSVAAIALVEYKDGKYSLGAGGVAQYVDMHPNVVAGHWDHDRQQPVALACFDPTGKSGKDLIFLSGMVYEFMEGPQSYRGPQLKKDHPAANFGYRKVLECENIWPKDEERYFDEKNSEADNIWVGSFAVGNFMNDPAGGEQVVFEHGMKRHKHDEYRHDLIIIQPDSKGTLTDSYIKINHDRTRPFGRNIDFAAVDIDDDAMLLRFRSKEAYFSDPHVVAVLQAAPYFEDLAHFNQFYVEEGGTGFGTEKGTGSSDTNGFSIQASAIMGFEQEVSIFGIKLFGIDYDMEFYASMGAEFQRDTEVSYSTEFDTNSETDRVIVEMTPYIRYVYDSYSPGFRLPTIWEYNDKCRNLTLQGKTEELKEYQDDIADVLEAGYKLGDYVPPKVDTFVVCLPQESRLSLINVDTYDKVAEANGFQKIRGNVLNNTPGVPGSYHENSNGLRDFDGGKNLASQSGDQSGFMHVPQGGGTITQSITESHAESNAINWGVGYDASMTVEAVGVKVGYGVGADYEGSHAWTNYNSTTCAGTVSGLPEDDSGEIDVAASYDFQWQFGKWKADLNGEECMVCGFLVKDVQAPPGLPKNLTVRDTTRNSITLNWQEPSSRPDHYKLYLCTDDPDNPYYVLNDNINGGITEYTIEDLAPGTTYSFVMRSFSKNEAEASTYTLPVSGRTQFGKGTKAPTVEPLADIHTVAGANVTLTAEATAVDGGSLRYQWQELVSENGITTWKPINRETGKTFFRSNVNNSMNGSVYRCAVTQFVGGQVVTIYTNGATVYVGQGDTETELAVDPDYATVQGSYPVARELVTTETKTVSATVDGIAYTLAKDETDGYLLSKANLSEEKGFNLCIPTESGIAKLNAGIADGKEVIELLGEDVQELTSVEEYLLVYGDRASTGIAADVEFDGTTGTFTASVPKADGAAQDAGEGGTAEPETGEDSSPSEPGGSTAAPEMEDKSLTYTGKYSVPDGTGDLYRVETKTVIPPAPDAPEGTEATTEISYTYYYVPDRTADPMPAAQQAAPGVAKYRADQKYYSFRNKTAVTIQKENTETVYDLQDVEGTSITLKATVKSLSEGVVVKPTGSVQFVIRNDATGATMTQYAKLGEASGQTASAVYVWKPTAAGTYTITARYVGSNELLPSVSQQKEAHAYEITSEDRQEETLSLILDCEDFIPQGGTIDLNPNLHTVTVNNDGSKVTDTSANNMPLTAEQVEYTVKTEFGGSTEGIRTLEGNNLTINAPGTYIVTAIHTYDPGLENNVKRELGVSKTIRVLAPEAEVQQQIYFTYSSLTKFATDSNIENQLINPNSGSTVTFTSENQNVATVNPETGAITPLGEGTTKIMATSVLEGTPTVTASYILNIRKKPVTITAPEIRVPYGTTAEEALRLAGEAEPGISDGIALNEITEKPLPYETGYKTGDSVGRYALTLGEIESSKYDVEAENGHIVVEAKELTASDFTVTALDKVYDGSAEAGLKVKVKDGSKVAGDSVTAVVSGSFDSPDAGEDKTVTYEIESLGGTNLENYRLAGGKITGTATATISKAPVTVTVTAKTSFVYDGQPKTVSVSAYAGNQIFTDFTVTYEKESEPFAEAVSAGTYQVIVTINPDSAGNYEIKGYSGNAQLIIVDGTQEAFTIEGIPENVCYGDVVTLSAPDAEGEVSYKVVSGSAEISDDQLTFTGTGNVTVRATAVRENYKNKTVTRQINVRRRELYLSAAAADRPYDASVAVDVTVHCGNVVPGDESKVAVTGTGTMLGTGVGSRKIVYVDHLKLTGEKAQYYVLSTQNLQTTVSIKPLDIPAFTIRAFDKTYDGTADADTEITAITGILPEDEGLVQILGSAAFEDANAAEDKKVTFTATGLAGISAGNYRLTDHVSTATATIRKAPVTVTVSAKTSFIYDGQPKAVPVNAYAENQIFTDFTVTYEKAGESFEKAVSAGTYQVIVTINPASAGNYVIEGYSGEAQLIIANGIQEAFTIEGIPENVCYGDTITLSAPDAKGEVSYEVVSGSAELSGSQLTFTGTGIVTVRATAVRENYENKTVTRQINVSRRELHLSAAAADRTYNAGVTVDVAVSCGNVVPGDEGKVAVTGIGTMLSAAAGRSKIVYVNHLELSGEKAEYYVLNTQNLQTTVNIASRRIGAFTVQAFDKTYDGTADADAEVTLIYGILPEDEGLVQILGTAAFEDENAAEDKKVTFTASGLAGISAGNYHLGTYASTAEADILPMQVTFLAGNSGFRYDGSAKEVEISAFDSNGKVFEEYTAEYYKAEEAELPDAEPLAELPSDAGEYIIRLVLKDAVNYVANLEEIPMTILQTSQDQLAIVGLPGTVSYKDSFVLEAVGGNGNGVVTWESSSPEVTVVPDEQDSTRATVTVLGDVGESINITAVKAADGNYTEKTAKAVFIPEPRTVSFAVENLSQTFDGTEKPVTVIPSEDGVTYTVTYNGLPGAPKDAGMYTVQVLADGNYRGGTTAMLMIDAASQEDQSLTVTMNGWIYGDEAAEPQCSEAPEGTTLTVTYSTEDGKKPVNAGKYTVYATYSGTNYDTFTASAEFEISRRVLTVTALDAERPYGKDNPVLTLSYVGFAAGEGPENLRKEPVAGTCAAADSPVNEEGYPIEVSGGIADNYTFVYVPGTLTITGASGGNFYITGAGNTAVVGDIFTLLAYYDDQMPQVRWESSDESVAAINEDGKVIALKKGNVTFTATIIDPNYAEGITADFDVRVDSVSVMLIPSNLVLTYNGRVQGISLTSADEEFVPVLSGPGKNVEITYELNSDPTVTQPRNAGVYTVIYRITDPSYTGSGSAQLTINKASVALKADNLEKIYGEENPAYTYSGLLGEDAKNPEYLARIAAMLNFTSDADSTGKLAPAGVYPISLTAKDGVTLEDCNYNLSIAKEQGSLKVLPRELLIHVKDVSRLYGEENPQPGCRFDGFVNGEDEKVLTGELVFTYAGITKETPVGVYPNAVTAAGLEGSNYDIRYVYEGKEAAGAALTIEKLPVTVSGSVAGEAYLAVNFSKPVPGLTTENFTVILDGEEVEIEGVKTNADFTLYIIRGSFCCGKSYEIEVTLNDNYDLDGNPVTIVPGCSRCPGDHDCPCRRYTDLDPTQWYHESVDFVLNNNMMNGTGEKIFQPDAPLSRAMLVTILWRLEGCPIVESDDLFDDVPEDIWYTEAVRWAAEKKVVLGIGENLFAPEDNVTREQLAAILWRYTGEPEAAAIPENFTDTDTISEYAEKAVAWAVEQGILKGRGANTIVPLGFSTRAEAATMIMRYVNVLAEINQK